MPDSSSSRWPIGLLCLISTVLLGVSGGFVIAPLILGLLLVSYLLIGGPTLPRPRTFYAMLLAIPFALWWRYGVEERAADSHVQVALLIVFGLYMMAVATQQLLAERRGGSSDYALACAVMGLGIAGAAASNPLFFPLLIVFAAVLLIHLRRRLITPRPSTTPPTGPGAAEGRAWGRYGAALLMLLALTAGLQVLVVERLPELNRWMIRRLVDRTAQPRAGFDRTSGLSSIARVWDRGADNQVALRVFSEEADVYLRGAVYDRYERGAWRIMEEGRALEPAGSRLGRSVFNARREEAEAERVAAVVYPSRAFADAYFIPLGTHQVAGYGGQAWASEAQTIRPGERGALGGYAYFASRVDPPPPTAEDLHVPAALRRPLRRIARRVMSPAATPRENLDRLQRYFAEHFTYRIGLELKTDKDPVIEFLEDIRAGHCEYFASAGALLLRSIGIPARYATGFMCDEEGWGDLRLARRKDAHAWVEAYLPGEGAGGAVRGAAGGSSAELPGGGRWVRFDPTPPSARPAEASTTTAQQLGRWLEAQWRRLAGRLFRGGLTNMIGAAWDWLLSLPARVPLWAWGLLVAAGLGWVFRENIRKLTAGRRGEPIPPRVLDLRAKLARAEKLLGRHGLRRPPSMTAGAYLRHAQQRTDLPAPVRHEAGTLLDQYQRERFREPEARPSGIYDASGKSQRPETRGRKPGK